MLFYCLPILCHFLPPEYVHHLSLLVSAMHILLSDAVKFDDLENANIMLCTFYQTAGDLYTLNAYTANMHSLKHMVPLVRLWGPLWAYSMFGFENLNGYLGLTFHGTAKIVNQISFQIQMAQTIPYKLCQLSNTESPETQAYIKKLLSKSRANMLRVGVEESCYVIGKIYSYVLSQEEAAIFSSQYSQGINMEVQKFERLMLNNVRYCSSGYTRSKSRNNSMCAVRLDDGSICFGLFKSFYILPQHSIPFCLMQKLLPTRKSPLSSLRPPRSSLLRDEITPERLCNQIVQIETDSPTILAVPVSCIIKKCVMVAVPIHGRPISHYIIPIPNVYEIH